MRGPRFSGPLAGVLLLLMIGCGEKAPTDEYPTLCRQRLDLANTGHPVPTEDPVPGVRNRQDQEQKALAETHSRELQELDVALQTAIDAAAGGPTWTIRREFDQKRSEIRDRHRQARRELEDRHEREMAEAQKAKARFDEGMSRVSMCRERLQTERPCRQKTACQSAAQTLAAFDACRDPFGSSYMERCLSRNVPGALRGAKTPGDMMPECTLTLENMVVN